MSHAQQTALTKHRAPRLVLEYSRIWNAAAGLWNAAAEGSTPHKIPIYFPTVYKYFASLPLKCSRKESWFPEFGFPSKFSEDKIDLYWTT